MVSTLKKGSVLICAGLFFLTRVDAAPKRKFDEAAFEIPAKRQRQTEITEYFQPIDPEVGASINYLAIDTLGEIASYLDPISLHRFSLTHSAGRDAAEVVKKHILKSELEKMRWRELPEVTLEQVASLKSAGYPSEIQWPLSGFSLSYDPVSVGLYRAVMGSYPSLFGASWISLSQFKAIRQVEETYARWDLFPESPVIDASSEEIRELIALLNKKSGRRFRLMTPSEEEYSHRFKCFGADVWVQESFFGQEDLNEYQRQVEGVFLVEER